jgi:hypothetical protein
MVLPGFARQGLCKAATPADSILSFMKQEIASCNDSPAGVGKPDPSETLYYICNGRPRENKIFNQYNPLL